MASTSSATCSTQDPAISEYEARATVRAAPPMKARSPSSRATASAPKSSPKAFAYSNASRRNFGHEFPLRCRAVRRHRHRSHRRSAAPGHARRVPRGGRGVVRRDRRPEMGTLGRGTSRAGPAAPAERARRVCQPAADRTASGAARCLGAQAGNARRRGPDLRARAHRRHLLRRKEARCHERQRPVHLLGPGDRAHHARRGAAGHAASQEDRLHRQVQRARNFAAVARGQRTRDASANIPT